MEAKGPHISIKADTLFHIGGLPITNTLLTSAIVFILFAIAALAYKKQSQSAKKGAFFYLVTFILKSLYTMFESMFHEKTPRFFALLASFFLFILLQNWFGLLPGVGSILVGVHEGHEAHMVPLLRGNTADLNSTFSLAILSVILIQIYSVQYLGWKTYLKRYFNISSPINFVTGLLEVVQEFSRVISFSFRLFGNIFAGEVLLTVMAFLIPILVSFPFLMLEVFVGFIQALVFTMLTAVFISTSFQSHH